jgi:hypothetical protein
MATLEAASAAASAPAVRTPTCAGARIYESASSASRPGPTRSSCAPATAWRRPVALLSRNRLFQRCSREQLEHLATTAYAMSFEPGDMLCVEGADSPECYIIEEGHAAVTIGRKGVATVGEDDVVGERGCWRRFAGAIRISADRAQPR